MVNTSRVIVFIVNVDWYFRLHWIERAEYFKELGFTVHVVANFTDASIQNQLVQKGFVCHQLLLKRKSLNLISELKTITQLYHLILNLDPDLIHCITVKPNVYTGLINRFFIKKPIVYSITGLGAIFSSSSLKFRMLKLFIAYLYRIISTPNSAFIFENSDDYQLFSLNGILRNDNGFIIKGAGIDLVRFNPTQPQFNRNILFAARLLNDKGLHDLIKAKELLAERGVNFNLLVAGIVDTDVCSAIPVDQIEAWESEGKITWLGNVSDMPSLIQSCDIVCLPTTYGEGVPRILIESASCQRAIVTTDVVGCREIVFDGVNGLLVPPRDPSSLAKAINRLLDSSHEILNFGIYGRKLVEDEFSQEAVFEKTKTVYFKILGLSGKNVSD